MLRLRLLFLSAFAALSLTNLVLPARLVAWQIAPLSLATSTLSNAQAGIPYQAAFQAQGGLNPYTWQLAQGSSLPRGLRLHQKSGLISGTPTTAGEYRFTIVLADSNAPSSRVQRDFTMTVLAGMTIAWKRSPKVDGQQITGSLIVANHTAQAADLTVIVVAINKIDRATALGYQHFTIQPNAQQEIPFGAAPGPGSYQVRADAVAELADDSTTLRAYKQTGAGELVINEPL